MSDQRLSSIVEEPEWQSPHVAYCAGVLLFSLAAACLDKQTQATIVETGTCKGISALFLALGAQPDTRVHTFDPVDFGANRPGGLWNRWGVADRICYHRQSSLDIPSGLGPVSMAFFDVGDGPGDTDGGTGEHTYGYVREEWDAWRSHLVPGAIVLWHDAVPGSGVSNAVQDICQQEPLRVLFLPTGHCLALGRWRHDDLFLPAVIRAHQRMGLRAAAGRAQAAGRWEDADTLAHEADALEDG